MNDWSARDLQAAEFALPLGPGKGKDSAISLGPWFVTPDELAPMRRGDSYDIALTARINDEVIGADTVSSMSFSFGQMIAYASRGTDVRAGDVFASGTCGGGCLAELWGRHGPDIRRPLSPGTWSRSRHRGWGARPRVSSSVPPASTSRPSPPAADKGLVGRRRQLGAVPGARRSGPLTALRGNRAGPPRFCTVSARRQEAGSGWRVADSGRRVQSRFAAAARAAFRIETTG